MASEAERLVDTTAGAVRDRMPVVFLPHGGGPCFFMEWTMGPPDTWDALAGWLRGLAKQIGQEPSAILLVSAHWEEPVVTVGAHPTPPLIFDYQGFPPHTYQLSYPAPGSPQIAGRVVAALESAGISARTDPDRGLDHGVFVPLKLVYPKARIPVVPMSLRADLDAGFHLRLGEALAPLRDEGVLIIGSGMSFHNMSAFGTRQALADSSTFDSWLTGVVAADPGERGRALSAWQRAPAARESHPRPEHLLPLLVAAGAAGDDHGERLFHGEAMSALISGYGFGITIGSGSGTDAHGRRQGP